MRREVAGGDVQPAVVEAAGERLALDQELDFEAGQQDLVEHPDDQLGLTDGETPHAVSRACPRRHPRHTLANSHYTPACAAEAGCRIGSLPWTFRAAVPRALDRRGVAGSWPLGSPALAGAAQQPTFRAGIDLVNFGVTVTDRRGNFVDRPHARRFRDPRGRRAADDRRTSRAATSRQRRRELHLGLLFDTSGSMGDDIKLARSAAIKFLNTLTRRRGHDAGRLRHRGARRAVRPAGLPAAGRADPLAQAGAASRRCTTRSASISTAPPRTTGRKILVLFTDGGDTRSAHRLRRRDDAGARLGRHGLRRRLPRAPAEQRAQPSSGAA